MRSFLFSLVIHFAFAFSILGCGDGDESKKASTARSGSDGVATVQIGGKEVSVLAVNSLTGEPVNDLDVKYLDIGDGLAVLAAGDGEVFYPYVNVVSNEEGQAPLILDPVDAKGIRIVRVPTLEGSSGESSVTGSLSDVVSWAVENEVLSVVFDPTPTTSQLSSGSFKASMHPVGFLHVTPATGSQGSGLTAGEQALSSRPKIISTSSVA